MVVPLWRTISIIGSIVLSAAYLSWHVSTSLVSINTRFEQLDKSIGALVQSIDKLTADKIGKKDLELFCAKAQLRNRNWSCPFDDATGASPVQPRYVGSTKGGLQ